MSKTSRSYEAWKELYGPDCYVSNMHSHEACRKAIENYVLEGVTV